MNSKQSRSTRFAFSALVLALAGANIAATQGNYREVTEDDVAALQFNHYFTPDKQHRTPDFRWTFDDGRFTIEADEGEIPADLTSRLLPEGLSAKRITGDWRLKSTKHGRRIVFRSIEADGAAVETRASMPIYRSAPTIVRIGETQYVFGRQATP